MNHDIFLSYRRTDREFAAQLVRELEKRGLTVWYDADIEGGQDWRAEIVTALEASAMLVILFSESCNESRQLKKELAVADSFAKPVVPILIDDCKPKGAYLYELADRNWIEAWPEPHSHVAELVELLTALAGKRQAPAAQAAAPSPTLVAAGAGVGAASSETPLIANDEMLRTGTASAVPSMASAYVGKKRGGAGGGPVVWLMLGFAALVVGVIAALLTGGSPVTFGLAVVVAIGVALAARALLAGKGALARFNTNLRRL